MCSRVPPKHYSVTIDWLIFSRTRVKITEVSSTTLISSTYHFRIKIEIGASVAEIE
jgi:hypothetical protein